MPAICEVFWPASVCDLGADGVCDPAADGETKFTTTAVRSELSDRLPPKSEPGVLSRERLRLSGHPSLPKGAPGSVFALYVPNRQTLSRFSRARALVFTLCLRRQTNAVLGLALGLGARP
jgi:hypothetical protein